VQGRSPTCYSPVRHSSTPEGAFPFDLHVLSTPPAFVLSQNQTLQTKTKSHVQNNLTKQPEKSGIKKQPHPNTGHQSMAKNNNKQKPPNTLLSSQTTHPPSRATYPRHFSRLQVMRTVRNPPKWGFPSGRPSRSAGDRVATTSISYVRGNSESNCLIETGLRPNPSCAPQCVNSDSMFNTARSGIVPGPGDHMPGSGALRRRQVVQHRDARGCSRPPTGVPRSARESARGHPTRSTPAIFRLPRRNTNQWLCRKSDSCGVHSSLSIRTLFT
jgi:hypothetical protein